jgi:tight adherence protein B
MILAAAVFAAVLLLVLGAYFAFVIHPERKEQRKLKTRLKTGTKALQRGAGLVKEAERLSSVAAIDALLKHATAIIRPLRQLIVESGTRMTVGRFVFATGCAVLLPVGLSMLRTGSPYAGLMIGACLSLVPFLWLKHARKKRLWKFEEQFPEAIDLISRALRAGHTFQVGLTMVAEELPAPVGPEFRQIYDHQNFGMPVPDALRAFAERIPVLDAKFFVTAVLTQRDAGGNLAEVLDNLASVIRERFKVKRQVRVISAHGRITGLVLGALPPALAGLFAIISPKHIETLYTDPLGRQMIVVAIVLQVVGSLIVKKIVNIEY